MKKSFTFGLILIFVMSILLAACGPSSSIADITFVVGNGSADQKIHDIIYPNQQRSIASSDYTTKVAPGNYRNYVINDGTQLNIDKTPVGDSAKLLDAVLPTNTRIKVGLTALWMLNQNSYIDAGEYKGPLVDFYTFADKYNALNATNDKTGNVNSSTPGWNSMLAENFWSALQHALIQAIYNIQNDYDSTTGNPMVFKTKLDDGIWKNNDITQRDALAAEISRLFQSEISKMTGVQSKMFCGSGTQSGWDNPDPNQAGQPGNKFECADVRIQIDSVIPVQNDTTSGSTSLIEANKAQYQAAWELYHEQTDCWLGIQNAIDHAANSKAPVIINVDASSCNPTNADGTKKPTTIVLPNPPTPTPAAVEPTATTKP